MGYTMEHLAGTMHLEARRGTVDGIQHNAQYRRSIIFTTGGTMRDSVRYIVAELLNGTPHGVSHGVKPRKLKLRAMGEQLPPGGVNTRCNDHSVPNRTSCS